MISNKKVELLAPCGSFKALEAAIINGADAVYLGGGQFGARHYATNFTNKEIAEAIKLAHLYNVKVYVTVNTLIYDHEFQSVMDYIDFLYNNDVDAVIIQDIGLLSAIRNYYPDLLVHASTQMTIHNFLGAKLLSEIGLKRIVLARECSLKEIEMINQNLNIETEVFVHGALCVCYSGQCLMSSFIGGRSGNRGRCAQPCRKLYDLAINGEIIEKAKYLLSPKDLNTILNLDKVIASGVSSLKVEGRMKSAEYVAIVVGLYRKAIDMYYENKHINFSDNELTDLAQIFNRGFTQGFMFNQNGINYINHEKNNNTGVLVGKVISAQANELVINCCRSINLHDGLYFRFAKRGYLVSKLYKNNQEVTNAKKGDKITLPLNANINVGDLVYKTKDYLLEASVKAQKLNKISLKGKIILKIGQPAELIIWDEDNNEVSAVSDFTVEESINQETDLDTITRQVCKLGNTPFNLDNLEIIKDDNIFIIISTLNQLRRMVVDKLVEKRANFFNRQERPKYKYQFNDKFIDKQVSLSVYCRSIEQVKVAKEANVDNIYVSEAIYNKIANKSSIFKVLPSINHNKELIPIKNNTVISDLGSLLLIDDNESTTVTNVNLNITNSEAIKFLKDFSLSRVTLSLEMNESAYKSLLYENKSSLEIIVYGYQQLMETKYCIFHENCQHECQNQTVQLIDGRKERFNITMNKNCHMHIYNCKNLILADEVNKLIAYGYRNFSLQFTTEDEKQAKAVIKAYQDILYHNSNVSLLKIINSYKVKNKFTRGYFTKEIL